MFISLTIFLLCSFEMVSGWLRSKMNDKKDWKTHQYMSHQSPHSQRCRHIFPRGPTSLHQLHRTAWVCLFLQHGRRTPLSPPPVRKSLHEAPCLEMRPGSSVWKDISYSKPSLKPKQCRPQCPGKPNRSLFLSLVPPLAPLCWAWGCDLQDPSEWSSHRQRWCQF